MKQMVEILTIINSGNTKQLKTQISFQLLWLTKRWTVLYQSFELSAWHRKIVSARKSGLQWSRSLFLDEHVAESVLLKKVDQHRDKTQQEVEASPSLGRVVNL